MASKIKMVITIQTARNRKIQPKNKMAAKIKQVMKNKMAALNRTKGYRVEILFSEIYTWFYSVGEQNLFKYVQKGFYKSFSDQKAFNSPRNNIV